MKNKISEVWVDISEYPRCQLDVSDKEEPGYTRFVIADKPKSKKDFIEELLRSNGVRVAR